MVQNQHQMGKLLSFLAMERMKCYYVHNKTVFLAFIGYNERLKICHHIITALNGNAIEGTVIYALWKGQRQ